MFQLTFKLMKSNRRKIIFESAFTAISKIRKLFFCKLIQQIPELCKIIQLYMKGCKLPTRKVLFDGAVDEATRPPWL